MLAAHLLRVQLRRASAPAPSQVHDRMTECVYPSALKSFTLDKAPQPVFTIPLLSNGRAALEKINKAREATA